MVGTVTEKPGEIFVTVVTVTEKQGEILVTVVTVTEKISTYSCYGGYCNRKNK
jgi:hypothetical protein